MKRKFFTPALVLILSMSVVLSACSGLGLSQQSDTMQASGTISVTTIEVAPEVSGKIAEIKADKGDSVKAGDVLVVLDQQVQQAQLDQANAALQVAQANLDVAQEKQNNAQVQYDLASQSARQADKSAHSAQWSASQSSQIELPAWYFEKDEQINALQSVVAGAQSDLQSEQTNLENEQKDASNSDFISAEKHLAEAQAAYTIALQTHDEAQSASSTGYLLDSAQKTLDSAKADLDSAQKLYDQMLSTDAADRIQEARARVAVAQERLNNAQDALDALMTGDNSLQLQSAQSNLNMAKTGVTQAQAALAQAQDAAKLAQIQLNKTNVVAPTSGIVLSRPMNPGEIAAAGADVIEIGSLDTVTLTVYIPENEYGHIQLGQKASVSVDSFPGRTFDGSVTYIANEAEYTPRNVQTVASRSTTVYRVEISLPNSDLSLKPGMPADATFSIGQ